MALFVSFVSIVIAFTSTLILFQDQEPGWSIILIASLTAIFFTFLNIKFWTYTKKKSSKEEKLTFFREPTCGVVTRPSDVELQIFSSSKHVIYEDGKHFIIPRSLLIAWSDEPNYWVWFPNNEESPNETVEAVALIRICWLDITGKYDTKNLTPGVTYEVVFIVKLEDSARGWDTPINLKLVLPNGQDKPQEQKVSLEEQPKNKWIDIKVGEFAPEKSTTGEISFSMYEHEAGVWKKGLFVKGVEIRPKKI